MGNDLCNGGPEEELERIEYNPDEEHPDEEINKIIRKGEPSPYVGFNINKLPDELKESGKLTTLQEKITKLMAHEKRHNKPLVLTKKANEKNYLSDPYYIRSNKSVYIGEWVLDKECNQVVPGGLGRLYTDDRIIEGEILTKTHASLGFFDETHVTTAQPLFMHNKEKANFFSNTTAAATTTAKNEPLVYVGSASDEDCLKVEVMLNGEGRSFTRTSEQRGTFKDGLLWGKGHCHIKEGEDVYEFTGEFKEGKKNGKGIEKFKLTSYDGDFENDKKKGKGTLTLLISRAYDEERLQEEAKLAMMDKESDPSEKVKKVKAFISLRNIFEGKLAEELKKDFKWIPPSYPPKSMINNENILIEHHRRKKFLENYKGDFDHNEFHGNGIYTWFNGKRYNGEWKNGQMDGIGEFFWPKGVFYRGGYEKDMRHTKGEMIWSFDKRFRGQWAYGLRHGYGELIEIETVTDKDDNNTRKYFLRVKGALYNMDKLTKQYFTTTRQIDDIGLYELQVQEKLMIGFVKDIKLDERDVKIDERPKGDEKPKMERDIKPKGTQKT